jgi:hypothetical protein
MSQQRGGSPFSGVRWSQATPVVRVDGRWYELESIDGTIAAELVAATRQRFGDQWQQRFSEDLDQVLEAAGHRLGARVDLVVKDPHTGASQSLAGVAVTAENRRAIRQAQRSSAARVPAPAARSWRLTRSEVKRDLDQLARLLEQRYAYLSRLPADACRSSIDAIRAASAGGMERTDLALAIGGALSALGDGHSGLGISLRQLLPGPFASWVVKPAGRGLVALRSGAASLVDSECPYLEAIDGVPIERWLQQARPLGGGGTAAFALRRAARNLRFLGFLRQGLGLSAAGEAELHLASEDGRQHSTVKLPVAAALPDDEPRSRPAPLLPEGVGYLRIGRMAGGVDGELLETLARQRDHEALVLDLRGNGGGNRSLLLQLFPLFMSKQEQPHLANVAALRLGPGDSCDPEGCLADRFIYPLSSSRWSPAARACIVAAEARFHPEWSPPAGAFSPWHYLALEPPRATPFRCPGRLALLMDSGCFSATEILLGAFKGRPGVALVGSTSGGGSGRPRGFDLPASRLAVRLSSMASFRPDGRLYEQRGIEPDVEVWPSPGDVAGMSDRTLEAALASLRSLPR